MKKKSITVLLALFLFFAITVNPAEGAAVFEDNRAQSVEACIQLGMIKGAGEGVTEEYLKEVPKRYQAAIMLLRLKGMEESALNYNYTNNFSDHQEMAWQAGKNMLGYLFKNQDNIGFRGYIDGTFKPYVHINAQMYYKIMLVTLGYVEGEDFAWNTTNTLPGVFDKVTELGMGSLIDDTEFTIEDMAIVTVEALKTNLKNSGRTLSQNLVDEGLIDEADAENLDLTVCSDETVINQEINNVPTAKRNPVLFNLMEQERCIIAGSELADDLEGDVLNILEIDGAHSTKILPHGIITLMEDGRISYQSNDVAADIVEDFNVTVSDGTDAVVVNIRINVTAQAQSNTIENHPPTAKGDPLIAPDILEMNSYTYNPNTLADDLDGDHLRITAVNNSTGTITTTYGTVIVNNVGKMTYTSNNVDVKSTENIVVTLSDGTNEIEFEMQLTILPRNETGPEPLSELVTFDVNEQDNLTILPNQLATDADGDVLVIQSVARTSRTRGNISYDNNQIKFTSDDITCNTAANYKVTVSDGINEVEVNLQINIKEFGNIPPEAKYQKQIYQVFELIPKEILASDLVKDIDGDSLKIQSVARTSRKCGEISFENDKVTYVSDDVNTNTIVKYKVIVSDGTDTVDAYVEFHVLKVNKVPVNIGNYIPVTLEVASETLLSKTASDIAFDPDDDPIEIVGIYRLDYTNTKYDIPGEKLDLSPHYGYVYFRNGKLEYQSTRQLTQGSYVEPFYVRISDGTDTNDIKVKIIINNDL